MPIRKAGPQTVHSKVKQVKITHILVKTSHALSSLLDISEDEHNESAIPTISTSLLMTTNKNPTIDPYIRFIFLGVRLITCWKCH